MLLDVVEAKPLDGLKLWLRFEDGTQGVVDLGAFELRGALAKLKDPEFFARVYVDPELGTVAWPGGLDLDPAVLYAQLSGVTLTPTPGKP